jgi:hypothetical protein
VEGVPAVGVLTDQVRSVQLDQQRPYLPYRDTGQARRSRRGDVRARV